MPKLLPGRTRINQNFSLAPSTIEAIHRLMKENADAVAEHRGGRATLSGTIEWMVDQWGSDSLNMGQAARFLGMGLTRLRALTKEGAVPHRRNGRRIIYSRARLRDWAAAQ